MSVGAVNAAAGPKDKDRVGSPAGTATPAVGQYLTFMLDGAPYALGILAIKEIIEYGRVTVVPMMPAWIRGVINLRGAVVPVMDLAARFHRPPTAVTNRTCIVVVEVEAGGDRHHVGMVVDAVNAVLDIASSDIEPPPAMGTEISGALIAGMAKVNGRFVIILDTERVLSETDLEGSARTEAAPRALLESREPRS